MNPMSNSDARKRKAEAAGLPETTADHITRLCTENQALRRRLDRAARLAADLQSGFAEGTPVGIGIELAAAIGSAPAPATTDGYHCETCRREERE